MTRLFVVEVLVSFCVPTQLPTLHPLPGLALTWMSWPAVYCPVGQPALFDGEAIGRLPPLASFTERFRL